MDAMDIYWLTRLPALESWFTAAAIITGGLFLLTLFIGAAIMEDLHGDTAKKAARLWAKLLAVSSVAAISCSMGSVLAPSKEDLAIILAGSYVVNNEEMSKIPDNAAAAINKFLKEYSEEKQ